MDEKSESLLKQKAALEALRGQLHNLEESIADLMELNRSLPEGELRDRLFDEIRAPWIRSLPSSRKVKRADLEAFIRKL